MTGSCNEGAVHDSQEIAVLWASIWLTCMPLPRLSCSQLLTQNLGSDLLQAAQNVEGIKMLYRVWAHVLLKLGGRMVESLHRVTIRTLFPWKGQCNAHRLCDARPSQRVLPHVLHLECLSCDAKQSPCKSLQQHHIFREVSFWGLKSDVSGHNWARFEEANLWHLCLLCAVLWCRKAGEPGCFQPVGLCIEWLPC